MTGLLGAVVDVMDDAGRKYRIFRGIVRSVYSECLHVEVTELDNRMLLGTMWLEVPIVVGALLLVRLDGAVPVRLVPCAVCTGAVFVRHGIDRACHCLNGPSVIP